MAVQIDIVYEGSLQCKAAHAPSGKTLITEAPVDNGGKGESFSPTDLVATALGSCVLTIMGLVAQRNGLDIAGTTVRVIKEMTAVPIRRIGALKVSVIYPKDKPLSAVDRAKLEQAAKACPVKQSLHPDIDLVIDFA
jgi:putative redox protein